MYVVPRTLSGFTSILRRFTYITPRSRALRCSLWVDLREVDGDGVSDHDEVDPRRSGAVQAVKDFVALYGDNETLMNNTFQQFVRDEMPPAGQRL